MILKIWTTKEEFGALKKGREKKKLYQVKGEVLTRRALLSV